MASETFTIKAVLEAYDKGFSSGLSKAEKQLGTFSGKLSSGLGFGILSGIGQKAFDVIANGFTDMVSELNESSKAWQSFEGNMKILGKSKKQISTVRNELSKYATQTIYNASDMASTYSQLSAVGVKSADKLVTGFGGLAAAAEDPKQAMKTLSQQATQMAGRPTVAWQDFKLMLEQSPSGIAAVAKTMGKSTSQLVSDVQAGKVSTDEFFKAIEKTGNSKGFSNMAQHYKTVGEAMDGLKEELAVKLQPSFKKASDTAIKGIEKVIDALDKLPPVGKIVDPIKKSLPILAVFGSAVAAGFTVVSIQKFIGMLTGPTGLLASIESVKWAGYQLFATMAANPAVMIVAAIAAVITALVILYKKNETFRNFVNTAWADIKAAFVGLGEGFKAVGSGIVTVFSGIWSAIKAVGGFIVDYFQFWVNVYKSLWNTIKSGAQLGINAVTTIFNGFIAFVKAVGNGIVTVVNWIGNGFKTVFGAIGGFVQAGADAVKKGFSRIVDGAKKIGELPGKFLNWGKDMMENLKEGIVSGVKKVKSKLSDLLGWIKDHFHFSEPDKGPLSNFSSWMPDMMKTMAQGIADNTNLLEKPLNTVGQTIKDGLQNVSATPTVSAAQPQAAAAAPAQAAPVIAQAAPVVDSDEVKTEAASVNMLSKTVSTAMASMETSTTDTSNAMSVAFDATSANMKLQAQNIEGSTYFVENAFTTMESAVLAILKEMIGQTTAQFNSLNLYFKSLAAVYYSYGVDIMTGLKNGINSQMVAVGNVASDVVKKLKTTFTDGLGIASPSRWFFGIGAYSIEGLENGMSSENIQKFSKGIVGDMKGAFKHSKFSAEANVDYMGDDAMKEVAWMRKYDGGSVVGGAGDGKLGRFVSNMLGLVNDNSHGYSQSNRWGPDYDCSSSIITSLKKAGFNVGAANTTFNMSRELTSRGWNRLPYRNPKKGDILLNDDKHVEMALGNGLNAGFHSAHGHPETGDQAHEAYVGRDPGGWAAILRYKNGYSESLADAIEEAYNFKKYGFGAIDAEGDSDANISAKYAGGGSLASWLTEALKLTGQPMSLLPGLMYAAKSESGGNPNAVNRWDSNAKAGHPSKGLLQTIDLTFNAYKLPGHNNIFNPVDNSAAAIRYMIKHYGSVMNVLRPRMGHWYGYKSGTRHAKKGLAWVGEAGPELMSFGGGERVYTHNQSRRIARDAGVNFGAGIERGIMASIGGLSRDMQNTMTYSVGNGRGGRLTLTGTDGELPEIHITTEVNSIMDGRKVGYGTAKFVQEKNDYESKRLSRVRGEMQNV